MSPQKQIQYLAGLLLATDYTRLENFDMFNEFSEIESDIQEITSQYFNGFMDVLTPSSSIDEKINRLVSASAFISYFDMGDLRYEDQTEKLIIDLYSHFDDKLNSITGLQTSDFIEFYHFVKHTAQIKKPNGKAVFMAALFFMASVKPPESNSEGLYRKRQSIHKLLK